MLLQALSLFSYSQLVLVPKKFELRKAINRYKRAKESNANHHSSAPDAFSHLGTAKQRAALLKKRSVQVGRLEKIPMFKRILSRKQKVEFTVDGKKESVLLFKNGFTFKGAKHRFVLVFDSKFRGMVLIDAPFYKNIKWVPLQLHTFSRESSGVYNIFKPYALGASAARYYKALSKQVEARESQIDFSVSHSGRELRRIRKLL